MNGKVGCPARFLATWVALVAIGAIGGVSSADAQQGTVTGRIAASDTGQPLSGAQVFIPELDIGTISGEDGRYRLADVPVGEQIIRVRMLGYRPADRQITVTTDGVEGVDFLLPVSAVGLEEVVVTATGEQQVRSIGHAVGTIPAESLVEAAPVRDFSELLTGRTPGVTVRVGTGTVGSGSPIRIRGASSLATSNQPLIYVDGTRVNADPANLTVGTGGQETGALNINPEDIKSVEVLRGASAATLYGTEAANGIIRIQTKDGVGMDEGTRWGLWLEGGLQTEPNEYPANWEGVTSDGTSCPLTAVASEACTQARLKTFNPLENEATTPFSTGERWQAGGSARGRAEGINFYSSGEFEFSQGVYGSENELSAANLRGNFGGQLSEDATLNVSTGYLSRDVSLPQNDNNLVGVLANGLLGGAEEGAFFLVSFDEIATIDTWQETEQFMGSANFDWRPTDWLTAHATAGMDVSSNKDQQFFPVDGVGYSRYPLGERTSNASLSRGYTAEVFLRTEAPISSSVQSQSTVGSQFFVDERRTVFATGEELVPGTESITAAATTTADEATLESRTLGIFAQQRFSWQDRLFLTGGLRIDDNSAFGTDFGVVYYPSANASWVVTEEPWFEPGDWLGELRVRGAFGQAGSQPGTTDAVAFFQSVPVTSPEGRDATGVTFEGGNIGNDQLKPERTTELELGFEASLYGDRLTLSGTYYHSETQDVLVQRTLAPSLGVTEERFVNLAKTRNQGVEGQITALVDWGEARFSLGLTGSYNDNDLMELGEGVSPIQVQEITEHREGYPLAGYWDEPFTFEDENGDGIIDPSELTVGDTAVYLGHPEPPVELSATPAVTLFDRLELRSHWVARLGHEVHGETESLRCLIGSSRFRHDPGSSLEEQASCLATAFGFSEQGFVQDADFLRLQEFSASLRAPRAWAGRLLGAESLSLRVSGRNLGLWTGFDGLDPQVNGTSQNFITGGELTQPPLRYWNAQIRIGF